MISWSEESVELRSQRHGVDDHGVVAVDIENTDFQQCPVGGWSDQHGQVLVHDDPAYCATHGMQDVRLGDAMLTRWLADPHVDRVPCLTPAVNEGCLRARLNPVADPPARTRAERLGAVIPVLP